MRSPLLPPAILPSFQSLGLLALCALCTFSACKDSDDEIQGLTGERNGKEGDACSSYLDCATPLECVDGLCGIFGKAPLPPACPPNEQGPPGAPVPQPPPGTTTGPGLPGTTGPGVPGTTGPGVPGTTGAATTSTSSTSTTSQDTTSTEEGPTKEDPVPELCKDLDPRFRKQNPFPAGDPAAIAAGKALYEQAHGSLPACNGCHGQSGEGGGLPDSELNTAASKAKPDCWHAAYLFAPKAGSVMQSYQDALTEEQAWQIATFIRSLPAK